MSFPRILNDRKDAKRLIGNSTLRDGAWYVDIMSLKTLYVYPTISNIRAYRTKLGLVIFQEYHFQICIKNAKSQ